MYVSNYKFKCRHCYSPKTRRLGLFEPKDDYECYTDSYVKCFWGMCEKQKSVENFVSQANSKVITAQPMKEEPDFELPCLRKKCLVSTKIK